MKKLSISLRERIKIKAKQTTNKNTNTNKTKTVKENYLKFLQTGKVYIDTLHEHTLIHTYTTHTHLHPHTQTCQKTRNKIYYKYNIYIL